MEKQMVVTEIQFSFVILAFCIPFGSAARGLRRPSPLAWPGWTRAIFVMLHWWRINRSAAREPSTCTPTNAEHEVGQVASTVVFGFPYDPTRNPASVVGACSTNCTSCPVCCGNSLRTILQRYKREIAFCLLSPWKTGFGPALFILWNLCRKEIFCQKQEIMNLLRVLTFFF